MGWEKVSEHRWERPVDGMEGYYILTGNLSASLSDGREHHAVFSMLKIEADPTDLESKLRYAWKQLRYEQPQIAATVEGMKKVYEVPDETVL